MARLENTSLKHKHCNSKAGNIIKGRIDSEVDRLFKFNKTGQMDKIRES